MGQCCASASAAVGPRRRTPLARRFVTSTQQSLIAAAPGGAAALGGAAVLNAAAARDPELAAATSGGAAGDFSYAGQRLAAKVVDVYDGDTIRVVFRSGGRLVQHRARMAGYDSPEMKPPRASATRDREIAAAVAARDALRRAVDGRLVEIACGPFDKYGRVLVTVYVPAATGHVDVNAWMVAAGHGVPYAGGAKAPFA